VFKALESDISRNFVKHIVYQPCGVLKLVKTTCQTV